MRYRLIGSLLLCLFSASMFAAKFSANTTDLRVGESATRFSLQKEGAIVKLALENSRASALPAQIKLELINPRETIRATAMQEISIPSGSSISTIPLIKVGSSDYDSKELLWYRLRYRISVTDPSGKEPDSISGVISLSEITPDVFRLLVSAPQEVGKEAKYTIRVRTLHPLTGKPIGGMDVQSQMSYEEGDDERKLKSSSVTNLNGEALLEFKLPSPLKADEAEVKVVAERVASRGYRMMLAEIGLPPGADVDRASLEQAVKESGWDLNHYDVLPDRVVVYLWPRAGGVKFSFKFKPRYGVKAQTAPSALYDYYNPEARVVVAPTRFRISTASGSERVFINKPMEEAALATARGTDQQLSRQWR